ncbi:hypothetical protein [Peribacillus loiseleuriae]|uniref:hypothetical protein n=1 Tax=Peribacillus loiseleuriae TaxID=1679170 RepID=UPI003CFEFF2F
MSIYFYQSLSFIVTSSAYLLSIMSGFFVYAGLTTKVERTHHRLRFKEEWQEQKSGYIDKRSKSKSEYLFKESGNPFGLTAIRWDISRAIFMLVVFLNYILYPWVNSGSPQFSIFILVALIAISTEPSLGKLSIMHFMLNRLILYKKAKRNAELFSLYDMLVSEIQMMNSTRINIYSLLRTLTHYFRELNGTLKRLLSNWTSDLGPDEALELFAKEIDTSEAKSLATVLKTFDNNDKETILISLRGMEDMFVTSQIENYRKRRKLYVDLANIPVMAAHWLILFNFLIVIINMVLAILNGAKL